MVWWELILNWYRSALGLIERLPAWQQSFLIVVAIALIGLSISIPLIRLFTRPLKRLPQPRKTDNWKVLSNNSKSTEPLEELVKKHQEFQRSASEKFGPSERRNGTPAEIEKQIKLIAPTMLEEIRKNLAIATKPWDGLVLPFQADVWYNNPDALRSLPVNLQNQLSEAYIDIGLANDIYWLLNKLNHRNPELDKAYLNLRLKIAARLRTIVPVEEPVKTLTHSARF